MCKISYGYLSGPLVEALRPIKFATCPILKGFKKRHTGEENLNPMTIFLVSNLLCQESSRVVWDALVRPYKRALGEIAFNEG